MTTSPALRFLEADAWALQPRVFEALAEIVQRHAEGIRLDDQQIVAAIGRDPKADAPREPTLQMIGDTAVVAVRGVLARYADQVNQVSQPSGRSAESMLADLAVAAGSPAVRRVVLRIDSPGGLVAGTAEVADAIRGISVAGKPVFAFVDGMAASAAYWIASQADEIVAAAPTSTVGSIGVMAALVERQPSSGVKVHVVRSAPLKAPGSYGESISEAQVESVRRHIGDLAAVFGDAVAAGRGLTSDQQAAATTGEVFAAGRAQAMGLIDGVEAWDAFIARVAAGRALPESSAGGTRPTAARAQVAAAAYITGADATEPDPESEAMSIKAPIAATIVAALVASHPDHAVLITERAAAGDDEAQVRTAVAGADAAKAKAKAEADAVASAARLAELEAKAKADAEALASLKAEHAALQAKHDALAALKAGAKGNEVPPDGDEGRKVKLTRAEFAKDPVGGAKRISAGDAILVD